MKSEGIQCWYHINLPARRDAVVNAETLNQTKQHRRQLYFIDFLLFVLLALPRPTKLSLVFTRSISYGLS